MATLKSSVPYFEHRPAAVEIRTKTDWLEMRNWLNAPERTGEWAYDHINTLMDGTELWRFWFTDPDVAFHFKVRFG